MKTNFSTGFPACLLICIMLLSGCASWGGSPDPGAVRTAEIQQLWSLDGYPMNVYMGYSAPYVDTQRMVSEALYHCARSIAIANRIQVESALVSESSSRSSGISFATEGSAVYFEREIEEILQRLELLEVRGGNRSGVAVIAADPDVAPLPRPYLETFDSGGRPEWITRLPEIPGYLCAVGETLGYRFVRDSLEAADVLAAEALLRLSPAARIDARSYSVSSAQEVGGQVRETFQEGVHQVSKGALQGFSVLARWYDSSANRYYSLAAIPR